MSDPERQKPTQRLCRSCGGKPDHFCGPSHDTDVEACRLEQIGLGLVLLVLVVAACVWSCGCSVKSVLTKPATDGSVAQETAQLAVDTRRAVLVNGLEGAKLIRATTELVETAKMETAAAAQAVRVEVGGTATRARAVLDRWQATLDNVDRCVARLTETVQYCAYMIAGSISLVFIALAWRWGHR